MTISSTTTKNSYSGNASTVAFAYGFFIPASTDIQVIVRSATGTETVKAEGTGSANYGISGVGASGGGTVTFVTAPASGETVVLRRNTAKTQATDYVANDPFPAETHEAALDKLTIVGQDLQEQVDRSIKLSRTNTMTSTEFTTSSADRASKVLAFDSAGELAVTQELGTVKGNWAASTAYVLRDIIKDTSNNNIYICITAHTSSGSQPIASNTDSAKWSLLVDAASATTSQSAAASSATAAASSASAASTSESNASSSASTASTQATNASNSATAAASSASAAATSYDSFDDRYLGAKSSNPSTDNDGNALVTGALYWNSSTDQMFSYTGSAWAAIKPTSSEQTDISALAASAVIADMALLATTDCIADMALLATTDIIADMNTLATSDIVSDLNTLATSDIVTDINLLATSDIVSDLNTLATSDIVADLNTLATSDIVSDINTLATSDIVTDLSILATSDIVSDLNTLATSDIVSDINVLATSDIVSDLNTLATSDIVTDLNLLATSANVTAMGLLGTSGNVTAMGLLGTSAVVTDLGLLGTSAVVTDMDLLGTSANVTNMATLGASGVVANIATTSGIAANITTVAGVSANVTTVANNIAGVNSFAERYRVDSSNPSSSLDAGDLAFNTSDNALKYYNGTSWASITAGIGSMADDTTPQLGGDLDVNGNDITSASNADVDINPHGTGDVVLKTDLVKIGGGSENGVISSNGAYDLTLETNSGTDSGIITITDAANGDIAITPNGTGDVILDGLKYPQADGSANQFLKTDGNAQLAFATVDLTALSASNLTSGTVAEARLPASALGSVWTTQASNFTAVARNNYFIDTSSNTVTATLPASGTAGDEIHFLDATATFDTNNFTVARNSHKIQGDSADLTVATERAGFTLVYYNATQGWLLKDK